MYVVRTESVFPNRLRERVLAVRVADPTVIELVHDRIAAVALIVLVEAVGMVCDHVHRPSVRGAGPDDRAFAGRNPAITVEAAVEILLIVVEIIGIVIDAGAALDLRDAYNLWMRATVTPDGRRQFHWSSAI